jgi:hypothetical protein
MRGSVESGVHAERYRPSMSWRPSLADRAALVFVGVAVAFIVFALTGHELGGWASNMATEFVGIALTVLVVERIVRVEERRRRSPRVGPAIDYMAWEFHLFVAAVASDYATTHRDGPIIADAFELFDRWLEDQEQADGDHIPLDLDGKTLVDLAWDFGMHVEPFDRSDRDVLEPELVVAIREMFRSARIARDRLGILDLHPPEMIAQNAVRLAYQRVVREARRFGEVLKRYARPEAFSLSPEAIERAEELRATRFAPRAE